jgi:hypothetical protein
MKFENTYGIRKSINYYCAQAGNCFPTSGNKKATKKKWLEDKELYLGDISGTERVLVAVYILTDEHKKPLLMDAVTGSLYRPKDGRCFSSDTLHMKKFTKAEGLAERLINIKSDQYAESE